MIAAFLVGGDSASEDAPAGSSPAAAVFMCLCLAASGGSLLHPLQNRKLPETVHNYTILIIYYCYYITFYYVP